MPSRRGDIEMTPDERVEFLESEPFGVLGTIGPGGYPHQVNIGFAMNGPDAVVMSSFGTAQKVVNVRRSPRTSLLVEKTSPYSEIRGVLMSGPAEIVDDRDQVASWLDRLRQRSARLVDANLPPIDDERMLSKRVLLVLAVQHVVSWDHRKLGGAY